VASYQNVEKSSIQGGGRNGQRKQLVRLKGMSSLLLENFLEEHLIFINKKRRKERHRRGKGFWGGGGGLWTYKWGFEVSDDYQAHPITRQENPKKNGMSF